MADTVVTDAVAAPTDEGIASVTSGNEDWGSAGIQMLVGEAVHSDSYVRSGLGFSGHDGGNDTVDVDAGIAYLSLSGETVDVQSGKGGSTPPSYDTTLPDEPSICVILPSATTVSLQDSTLSQVWLAYATDGTVTGVDTGEVYLRSDDTGSETAPAHPSVELGSSNPDNASADTELNRESSGGLVPAGVIAMWSGSMASIPDGWTLCDGTDGTPDLTDRFVVGAGDSYSVDDTGGTDTVTLTESEIPSHTHTANAQDGTGGSDNFASTSSGSSSTQETNATGGGSAHENRPPYYALAYIMKL